jgi:UDP-2,3-diacylglucosamine pyrophosphatase LpxH
VRTLIASDWHLGHFSPAVGTRLGIEFLERARRDGDAVILNGDVFEGLFEPVASAEAAQPRVSALIADLSASGRLRRTEGNHDPGSGPPFFVLDQPGLGRVLVMHGHQVDPVHDSPMGNFGDGISRRFGRLSIVRGAAHAAAATVAALAASRVDRMIRARCREIVRQHGCDLGVFGHNHRRYLTPGDSYANAGCLQRRRLEYLVLDEGGARLTSLELDG